MADPVYIALQGIDAAIKGVHAPTGTIYEFSPVGNEVRSTYRGTQQELEEVVEDLIGVAFALAQTHLKAKKKPNAGVEAVANYWKHRDQWDPSWSNGTQQQLSTMAAIRRLGGSPPMAVGQLKSLAKTVLGVPFSGDALWEAINR
jgi:hypothetical protein